MYTVKVYTITWLRLWDAPFCVSIQVEPAVFEDKPDVSGETKKLLEAGTSIFSRLTRVENK